MGCQEKSLSFSFYYKRETDVIASILGGSRKKNFRGTHVYLLAQKPAICGIRVPIDFGCGMRIDASKFQRPSVDFSHFWYYIQYMTVKNFDQLLAILTKPVTFSNVDFQNTFFSYISALCNAIFRLTFSKSHWPFT